MAQQTTFTCLDCRFSVEDWSDGNPYIATPDGKRHYWHHPCEDYKIRKICKEYFDVTSDELVNQVLQQLSGCEFQFICSKCLKLSMLDEKTDERKCSNCGSTEILLTSELADKECPSCHKGKFDQGRFTAIS
jgi:hypothetical protein